MSEFFRRDLAERLSHVTKPTALGKGGYLGGSSEFISETTCQCAMEHVCFVLSGFDIDVWEREALLNESSFQGFNIPADVVRCVYRVNDGIYCTDEHRAEIMWPIIEWLISRPTFKPLPFGIPVQLENLYNEGGIYKRCCPLIFKEINSQDDLQEAIELARDLVERMKKTFVATT